MNLKNIENTIGDTLENQKAYVTFTGIVKLSSIFEYTRKIYEENIASGSYFSNMKNKYSEKAESLELLNSFRNTIHTNGDWHPKNKKDNLVYKLRSGEKIIKPGQPFEYDHWKLYRIVKDCIELNKLMALDNQPKKIRQTKLEINGQRLSVMKTDLSLEDWDKILPE